MKKVVLTILFIIILGFISFSTVQALELDLSFAEPGVADSNIASYIVGIYQFGVGIAGILAVGMIVAGAIYYSVSAGNPDKQRDARGMITGALWGVALLLGSYLILNTINPQIVKLESPGGTLPPCTGEEGEKPGRNCLPSPPALETNTQTTCSGDVTLARAGEMLGDLNWDDNEFPRSTSCLDEIVNLKGVTGTLFVPKCETYGIGGDNLGCTYAWPPPYQWNNFNLSDGEVWLTAYYQAGDDAKRGRCIPFAWKKNPVDSISKANPGRAIGIGSSNTSLVGLVLCK